MATEREAIEYTTPLDELMAKECPVAEDDLYLPSDGVFDWTSIKAIGDFAAGNPDYWRTISLKLDEPELSQKDIAKKLGLNQATVSRRLRKLRIG